MKSPTITVTYKNRVLASLPASDITRLAPHLSPVIFKRNQTLHDPGQRVDTVYFLEEGICSIVVSMGNGSTVEVGIIGRDGFVGLPAVLGTNHSPNRIRAICEFHKSLVPARNSGPRFVNEQQSGFVCIHRGLSRAQRRRGITSEVQALQYAGSSKSHSQALG
jgi:hypothetical protein